MREARFDTVLPTDWTGSKALGVFLGQDFCAEHEWGIRGVQEHFGISKNTRALGVNRRRIRQVPKSLMWVRRGIREGILLPETFELHYEGPVKAVSFYWRTLYLPTAKGLKAAWDEGSFIVTSNRKKEVRLLRQVYDAIRRKDAAVGIFSPHGLNPFGGQGLGIAIVSRMDKDTLKGWKDADREQQFLQKAKRDSGIVDILRKAGKRFFDVSPRLEKDGTIVYWLNPWDEGHAKAGWYSLQDLKDWAEGKGKVVQPPPPPPEPEPEQPEEWGDETSTPGASIPGSELPPIPPPEPEPELPEEQGDETSTPGAGTPGSEPFQEMLGEEPKCDDGVQQ